METRSGTKLTSPNLSLTSTNTTALEEREKEINFQDTPTKESKNSSTKAELDHQTFIEKEDKSDEKPDNEETTMEDFENQPMEKRLEKDLMEDDKASQNSEDSEDSDEKSREEFKNFLKDSVNELVNKNNSILLDEVQKIGNSFKEIQKSYNLLNKEFQQVKTKGDTTSNVQTPWTPITLKNSPWTATKIAPSMKSLTPLQTKKVKTTTIECLKEGEMENWDEIQAEIWMLELLTNIPTKMTNETQKIFHDNSINGEFLWNMTKEDLKELKLPPKATILIRQEIETIKGTSHLPKNLKCPLTLNMSYDSIIFSLQKYTEWISWNAIPNSKWKELLLENLSSDYRNGEIISFINEKCADDDWPTARVKIIQNSHKSFSEMDWMLLLLNVSNSQQRRSLKKYTEDFKKVYDAIQPLLPTFHPSIIAEFKKGLNSQQKDVIDRVKKDSEFKSMKEMFDIVPLLFPNTYKEIPKESYSQRPFEGKRKLDDAKEQRKQFGGGNDHKKRKFNEFSGPPRKEQNPKAFCPNCEKIVRHIPKDCWKLPENKHKIPFKVQEKFSRPARETAALKKMEFKKQRKQRKEDKNKPSSSEYLCAVMIENKPFLGLVDSGASHCFISQSCFKKLRLEYTNANLSGTEVHLGNNQIIDCMSTEIEMKNQFGNTENIAALVLPDTGNNEDETDTIILGRNCFQFLNIQIKIPFLLNDLSNLDHEILGKETPFNPEFIDEEEKEILLKALKKKLVENELTKGKFCNLKMCKEFRIPIDQSKARYQRQYRIPDALYRVITDQIKEWLEEGVIEISKSNSDHTNPLVCAPKPQGKWRICIDFRFLNSFLTAGETAYIPLIDEIFAVCSKSKIFSIIDLTGAYNKIKIHEEDRWCTQFLWNNTMYQHVGNPFGIKYLPSMFSKVMKEILKNIPNCLNYIDDIIIFSENTTEHAIHVQQVLDALTKANMTIKPSKCHFGLKSIKLLGHIISHNKLSIDQEKLAKLDNWPKPDTGKKVEKWIGFVNYFRRYFQCEPLLRPFTEVKNQKRFKWTEEMETCWNQTMKILQNTNVLHNPDPNTEIKMAIDASCLGLGAITFQDVQILKIDEQILKLPEDKRRKRIDELIYESTRCDVAHTPMEFCGMDGNGINSRVLNYSTNDQRKKLDTKVLPCESVVANDSPVWLDGEQSMIDDTLTPEPFAKRVCLDHESNKPASRKMGIDKESIQDYIPPLMEMKVLNEIQEKDIHDFNTNFSLGFKVCAGEYFRVNNVVYQRRVLSFQSRSLREHERRFGITKLEGLALVYGLKSNDHLIYGRRIHVYTDHQALISMFNLNNQLQNVTLNKWLETLGRYNFTINYLKGSENIIPDILSRKFNHEEIIEERTKEEMKRKTFKKLEGFNDFQISNAINEFTEFKKMYAEIPDTSNLKLLQDEKEQQRLLKKHHYAGHFGSRNIVRSIQSEEGLTWPGIHQQAVKIAQTCERCAQYQIKNRGYHPLRSMDAKAPFDVLYMDTAHMKSISGENSYNHTLILVDCCTKYVALEPLETKDAQDVANTLVQVFNRLGWPKVIITDGGTEFQAEVREMLQEAAVDFRVTAPYHHRSNGTAEINVKIFSTMLKKCLEEEERDHWDKYLSFIQFFMNNRIMELTQSSPFSLMFGRASNTFTDYRNAEIKLEDIKEIQKRWKTISEIVYPNINERVKSMKKVVEKKFIKQKFITDYNIGDMVMYLKPSYIEGKHPKWEPVYEGPVILFEKDKLGNFSGECLETGNITRKLAISHLKKFSEPKFILEKKPLESKIGSFRYLISYDEMELWVDEESTPTHLIRQFKEVSKLREAEKLSSNLLLQGKSLKKKLLQEQILKLQLISKSKINKLEEEMKQLEMEE
jgi:hypothetical protein